MLSNTTKAAAYQDMLDLINRRHIKNRLEDSRGGVCLVGAANRATQALGGEASLELQRELRDELVSRSPMLRAVVNASGEGVLDSAAVRVLGLQSPSDLNAETRARDGGLALVEAWNDAPWRRTRTVAAVLRDLAERYGALAREELIAELRTAVSELRATQANLQARIVELEEENTALREEVAFWKKAWQGHRSRIAGRQLREASTELAAIDDDLNATLARLTREGVHA